MKTDKWVLVVRGDEPAATIHENKIALEQATKKELFFGDLTPENEEELKAILAELDECGEWTDEDGHISWYPLWDDHATK